MTMRHCPRCQGALFSFHSFAGSVLGDGIDPTPKKATIRLSCRCGWKTEIEADPAKEWDRFNAGFPINIGGNSGGGAG